MKTTAAERELLELEHQYWRALQERDADVACDLTDFPCVVAGPEGVGTIDKKVFAEMVNDPRYAIDEVELHDVQVRLLGDDVAVVAYNVHEELTVEGKHVALDAADVSTWVRRDGHWACAAHCEALVGDPFGRDRSPADA